MVFLGIDVGGARSLQAALHRSAEQAERTAEVVGQAAALADLALSVIGRLHEVGDCLGVVAGAVGRATDLAEAFELPALVAVGERRSVGELRWNELRQVADHNTYLHGTVADQRARGRYSHEFDLHLGAPTRFDDATDSGLGPWTGLGGVVADALTHGDRQSGDWHVYHTSVDPGSTYGSLGAALDDVADATGPAPVAVFLDMKDPFVNGHDAATLDAVLRERLGDRLWSPPDLLAGAGSASTLMQAVATTGWPTVDELDGRVMVVLTGQVQQYREHRVTTAAAFVASTPDLDALLDPNVTIYNTHVSRVDDDLVAVIRAQGALLRVWGATSPEQSAATRAANWIAID